MQFLGFALIKQLINKNFKIAKYITILMICIALVFLIFNSDTFVYKYFNGENSGAITRSLDNLEVYGLKLPELFLPVLHKWNFLDSFAKNHYYNTTLIKGELGSPYLGFIGIIALIWLFFDGLINVFKDRLQNISLSWWQVNWIILYSLIGGINLVIGSLGFVLFRGTNRFSIVILTLALLFLVQALSKKFPNRSARIVAILLIPLVLWDQIPIGYSKEQIESAQIKFQSDKQFAQTLESSLPKGGMVFQLPVMSYPEMPAINKMADYSHFRPYLFTRDLRYSYGTDKGRGDEDWQMDTSKLPTSEMLSQLEKYGFNSVMINRNGYVDNANELIEEIKNSGKHVISENADLIAFNLNPIESPILPMVTGFSEGWSSDEIDHRWAIADKAKITFGDITKKSTPAKVKFVIYGIKSQKIIIYLNNNAVKEINYVAGRPGESVEITLDKLILRNNLIIKSDVIPESPSTGDPRELTFAISKIEMM